MAVSPALSANGVLRVLITADGAPLPDTMQLISATVRLALNRIPVAELVFEDGDIPDQTFPWADSGTLKPGVAVVVSLGYGEGEEAVFTGIVTGLGVQVDEARCRLRVQLHDKAVAMTITRHNDHYVDQKDSDIISTLVGRHSGLSSDVTATTVTWPQLAQHQATDWDFLLLRAQANGLLVRVAAAKVEVKAPATSAAPALKLTLGQDIMRFQAELDARGQVQQVETVSWSPATQAAVVSTAEPVAGVAAGNLNSATLAEVLAVPALRLQTSALLDSEALSAWAQAQQTQADLARVRGRVSCQGSALAVPGGMLELAGVGDRFNGAVFISEVQHRVADGNWISELVFGLAPGSLANQPEVQAPPAAGLLPGVRGLQIGTVLKLDADPQGQHRIQVSLPVTQSEIAGVWARLGQLHASNGFGTFFLPEVGDEVILGFLNDDPANPVVLGNLYSSQHAPPYALAAENNTKAVVTRCKHTLEFDEEHKRITLHTPGQHKLVLDDEAKSILLEDLNGNKLLMDASGIQLSSPKDIRLDAKGSISLSAVSKISLDAKADIQLAGLNISAQAQVGLTAKGTATAELSAAGQTTVKGSMVMIN